MSVTLLRPSRLPVLAAALVLGFAPLDAPSAAEEEGPLASLAAELRVRLEAAPEPLHSPEAVARFYAARAFRPAWTDGRGLTASARDLATAVGAAESHGLLPADYHAAALATPWEPGQGPDARAEADLMRTDAFLTYAAHLAGGRVLPQDVEEDWEPLAREADPVAVLERALAGGCVAESLEALAPADPGYRALRRALARYRAIAAGGGWPGLAEPPVLHPGDRSPAAAVLRARLALEGYLEGGEGPGVMDGVLVGALRAFQAAHGLDADGVAGRATWGALRVPAADRAAQIQANLERWRWRRGEPGPRYVRVNVPAFRLEAVEGGSFDLVLMDVQMPEMDGFEATRRLREKGFRKPIVGLTAYALEGDRQNCLDAGMDDYLTKPISPDVLREKVSEWTGYRGLPPAELGPLLESLAGNRKTVDSIIERFRTDAPEQLAKIREGVREQDASAVAAAAHRLRGSLLIFRAREAARLAECLETCGRHGDLSAAAPFVSQLSGELERVLEHLQAAIAAVPVDS